MKRITLTATVLLAIVWGSVGGCPPGGAFDRLFDPNSSFDPNFSFEPNSLFEPNLLFEPNVPSNDDNGTTDSALTLFDQVWEDFDQHYSYFEHKQIDWDALQARYRSGFDRALRADAFAEEISTMLAELHDFHVAVRKPGGDYVEVHTREIARNYTSAPRNRYAPSGYQSIDDVVWHGWLDNNIAYLRIDTLASDAFANIGDDVIENLFATYASADAMIVDIRPNNGGDETIAMKFAARFTDANRTYGYTRTRNGPGHDDFDSLAEKALTPSAGTRFLKPAACLIGQRCLSSAEWFTLMMRACPNVTLIGDTTRGSSGNPRTFELSNGVEYTVPTWIAYTDEQVPFEDVGIAPDIAIAADASFDGEHDYVVERAIEELTP